MTSVPTALTASHWGSTGQFWELRQPPPTGRAGMWVMGPLSHCRGPGDLQQESGVDL